MDIVFKNENQKFNYRVAAIVIKDGKALFQRCPKGGFYFLVGGRIQMGEDSIKALKREMLEEVGVGVATCRPLWLLENFFEIDGELFHELGQYYLVEPDGELCTDDEFVRQDELGKDIHCAWLPVGCLNEYNVQPKFLKERLINLPDSLEHLIWRDV